MNNEQNVDNGNRQLKSNKGIPRVWQKIEMEVKKTILLLKFERLHEITNILWID